MPYYVRVLVEKPERIPVSLLRKRLAKKYPRASMEVEQGIEDSWETVLLKHSDGEEFCIIERNPVEPGSLGEEELQEFIEEVRDGKPDSGARWLVDFLPSVKAIYAFQILNAMNREGGWNAMWAIQSELWSRLGGIFQSDGEGFSNRDGYTILWQFSDTAKGKWKCALLNKDGRWDAFEMELSNPDHRDAFLGGKIPRGAKRL